MTDRRSEPAHRAVWEDEQLERGASVAWLMRVAQRTADDAIAADDYVVPTNEYEENAVVRSPLAADVDDAASDDAAAAADAATDVDDAVVAVADAAAAVAAVVKNTNTFWKGADMREGLILIQVPGRYWGVTRVGYATRIEGDEWEFRGATVTRTGAARTLADLAANGPGDDHHVSEVDALPELLHRFTPRRVLVASEEAWGKHLKGAKP